MPRVKQEFACTKAGGGCGGYITCKLSTATNRKVVVICPKCKHAHHRVIQDGRIMDIGIGQRHDKADELILPISAWSPTSAVETDVHARHATLIVTSGPTADMPPEVRRRWWNREEVKP